METVFEAFDAPFLFNAATEDVAGLMIFLIRFLLPFIAVIILFRCARSMFYVRPESEIWGDVTLPDGTVVELTHWENVIGRSKASDVVIDDRSLSRSHAALLRADDGSWRIADISHRGGVFVGMRRVVGERRVSSGDEIIIGDTTILFHARNVSEEKAQAMARTRPGRVIGPGTTLMFLTEFQALLCIAHCIAIRDNFDPVVPIAFAALSVLMWAVYFFTRAMKRSGFEVETLAFFLCTLGMSVAATSAPEALYKQVIFTLAGVLLYFGIGWFLRDLRRVTRFRLWIAVAGLVLLAVNIFLAESIFGAKNWLSIAGISFQPSEFVKICFVFAGAAAIDRLYQRGNLILFIAFSGICVGALALMGDFGTALVFFTAYLVISFMRSGNLATVFLSIGGAGFAGLLAATVKPHIMQRFSNWGHAWENPFDGGYQQTRAMSAAASGGLFGVGAGEGWLHTIIAADTDMVFCLISEELGYIIAVLAIAAICVLTVFAVRSVAGSRGSFFAIASCAVVTMMMMQMILNVFGSVDILPFTGVTFPFVSRGGSSLISCWGMLAFIKAADTRQNASFAVRLSRRSQKRKAQKEVAAE